MAILFFNLLNALFIIYVENTALSVSVISSIPFEPVNRSDNSSLERDLLLSMGWPASVIDDLECDAKSSGTALTEVAIASGWVGASELYDHLAHALSFAKGDSTCRIILSAAPPRTWTMLQKPEAVSIGSGKAAINAQAMSISALTTLAQGLGFDRSHLTLLTRQKFIDALADTYGNALVSRAVFGLLRRHPQSSAKTGLLTWQAVFGSVMAGLALGAIAVAPRETIFLAEIGLSLVFILAIALRLAAAVALLFPSVSSVQPKPLSDVDLPRYTVFVPLFRETQILPHLAKALSNLDYPAAKLDIKIILESIDRETIDAALRETFPGNIDFIVVPDCQPRTKPKALNYALQFATGSLAVIYDAEDRPEPDQLRKAAAVFAAAPPELVCLQARLHYFNATENWLSRQFTIEYASLFRGLLPFLSRFRLPLPLGGTSNHFRGIR